MNYSHIDFNSTFNKENLIKKIDKKVIYKSLFRISMQDNYDANLEERDHPDINFHIECEICNSDYSFKVVKFSSKDTNNEFYYKYIAYYDLFLDQNWNYAHNRYKSFFLILAGIF